MFWIYKLKDFPVTDQGRTFFLHQYIQSWMPGMSNLMFWLLQLRHFFLYPLHVTRKSPHAHNNMTTKLALTSTDYLSSLRAKSSPNFARGHLGQITVCIMCFLYFLLSSVWKILLERETRMHRFFNFHIFKLALEFNQCLSISSPTCFSFFEVFSFYFIFSVKVTTQKLFYSPSIHEFHFATFTTYIHIYHV